MVENAEQFEIAVEPARKLINVSMRGFWDAEVMDHFQAAFLSAMESLSGTGPVYLLADTRSFPVQSQGNIGRLNSLMPHVASRLRRVAIITSAALVRMQIARVDGREPRRTFATKEEALLWLFADDADSTP